MEQNEMKAQQHGGNIYEFESVLDFSVNTNPLGPPKGMLEAMKQSLETVEHYPDTECTRLRCAISKSEGISLENIICGNGAAELLFSIVLALKPRRALLQGPTFLEYEKALQVVSCECVRYPGEAYKRECLDKTAQGFEIKVDILEFITEDLDMLFLCNPNNPTGLLVERDLLIKIMEECKNKGVFLVVDECFMDFVEDYQEHSVKQWLQQYPNIFLLKAFTKLYAMPGIRLGYGMCFDERVLDRMKAVTQPWNVSTIAQEAGIAALQEKVYVKSGLFVIRQQRVYLKEALRQLGYQVYDGVANYLFFHAHEDLYEACLKENILIRDCSNYDGLTSGYFRIAIKTAEENKRLINTLQSIE